MKVKTRLWKFLLAIFVPCNLILARPAHAQFYRGMLPAKPSQLNTPPQIEKLPQVVSDLVVTVRGKTFPGGFVVIRGGSSPVYTMANPKTGEFTVDVYLNPESVNKLTIYAVDRNGLMSKQSSVVVEQKLTPAEAPVIYNYPSYTNENMVDIYGKTKPGYRVIAYGGKYPASTRADNNGEFKLSIYLNPNTKNHLRIASIDRVNNQSPFSDIEITHDNIPPYPPSISNYPLQTRKTKVMVYGNSEAKSYVVFEYAGIQDKIQADDFGKFKGLVTVQKFALSSRKNNYTVYAMDRAGNRSKPVNISITHVHFFNKHMVKVKPGMHNYWDSAFLSQIKVKSQDTLGPSLFISYDYIVKSPLGIGLEIGSYGTFEHKLPEPQANRISKLYITNFFAIANISGHFMIEKFDFHVSAGAGYMYMAKIVRQIQAGSGENTQVFNFNSWIFKTGIGVDYYVKDYVSVGIEENILIGLIKDANLAGTEFRPGGNALTITTGFHF